MRSDKPECNLWCIIKPASMVLPKPTSSASITRSVSR
ncbi:hypothetical protein BMETH_1412_0 [methanotrophic bacterial endosymbiont of Bathymodiolus sp.]|nr:hypothetical protein BMETH_1412_0 [methanotrophic bacterial endosymbiont of Bathymodiolus sp.]